MQLGQIDTAFEEKPACFARLAGFRKHASSEVEELNGNHQTHEIGCKSRS